MGRHKWTDVDRTRLLTAVILTRTFSPELAGVETERQHVVAVLGFDIVRETHGADDVTVRRIGPDVLLVYDRHPCFFAPMRVRDCTKFRFETTRDQRLLFRWQRP